MQSFDTPDFRVDLLRARQRYVAGQLSTSLSANFIATVAVAGFVWGHAAPAQVLGWIGLVLMVTAYRWVVGRGLPDPGGASVEQLERAWRHLRAGFVASGIAWGASAILAYPADSPLHLAAYVCVIAGLVAGAVPMVAVSLAPYACYCLAILVPLGARLIAHGEATHALLGAAMIIMSVMMIRAARGFSQMFEESSRLRARLERQASIDPLTELANRRALEEAFQREWRVCTRESTPLSVLVIDVDYFKPYNDHYGHVSGDDCLRQIGACVRSALRRPRDLAARVGGEEFIVLLPAIDAAGARQVATSIRQAVREAAIPHAASPIVDRVTLSVGTATDMPTADGSPQQLIERADRALYQAKESGRDQVCAWGMLAVAEEAPSHSEG